MRTSPLTEMMNRLIALISALLLFPLALSGQDTDFGVWYEVKAEHNLIKGLRLDADVCLRTDDNASNIESYYIEPGLRYKFSKYFAAGVYYRFIGKKEDDTRLHPRHRLYVEMKGNLPLGRFSLSARYRIQEQFKTYIEDEEDKIPVWYNRLRFELSYDVPSVPLEPYVNAELFSQIFSSNDIMVEKMRYIAGIDYKISKRHALSLEYIYNNSKVTKPAYMNIISVRYSLEL